MDTSEQDLLNQFGRAVLTHNAALFVGAGMSRVAAPDSPDWAKLVEPFRRRVRIPAELKDLPLVAQYFVQHSDGNRQQLEVHVANELSSIKASRLVGHERLAALPISEVWTTNYDQFLEQVMPKAQVVVRDEDLADRRTAWNRRIIKMHGGLDGQGGWAAPPVITRQDYERYELTHPRHTRAPGLLALPICGTAAGGGGQDSLAVCITKTIQAGAAAVRLLERKPPFDAETVADEVAELAGEYGITAITGDNFSGDTWKSMFLKRGLSYTVEKRNASALYRAFAPVVTGKRVELPDPKKSLTVERGLNQLVNLVKREGGEKITHAQGEHDDVANALAGGVLLSIKPPGGASVVAVVIDFTARGAAALGRPRTVLGGDQGRLEAARGVDLGGPVHCRYCNIPASDPERAYYQCPATPKPERERRIAADDWQRGK